MSIKIHDGLRATEQDVFQAARAARAVLEPAFFKKFKALVDKAKAAAAANPEATWDEALDLWGEGSYSDHPILSHRGGVDCGVYGLLDELSRVSTHTLSEVDIAYEVCFLENPTGGAPLVLVFGEQARLWRGLLLASGVVETYGYWDNADAEEDLSSEAWEERRLAWSVLKDKSANQVGLSLTHPGKIESVMSVSPLFQGKGAPPSLSSP